MGCQLYWCLPWRSFHGIFPSKDKQERQMQKDAEAAAAKRAATSENPESLRRLHAAQKAAAAPYIVLNGSVCPTTPSPFFTHPPPPHPSFPVPTCEHREPRIHESRTSGIGLVARLTNDALYF